MQGTVIASLLRKRRQHRGEEEIKDIDTLIHDPVHALVHDHQDVDTVLRVTELEKLFGLESRSEPIMRREIQIDGLLSKGRERMAR